VAVTTAAAVSIAAGADLMRHFFGNFFLHLKGDRKTVLVRNLLTSLKGKEEVELITI
jgi:hypothetical protein